MQAMMSYYSSIEAGHLPVSIPIAVDGEPGMATNAVPLSGDPNREAMAYSASARERARAAVLAAVGTAENVGQVFEQARPLHV